MTEEQKDALRVLLAGRGPLLLAIGAAVGGLILLCLFALLLLRPEEVAEVAATPDTGLPTFPSNDVLVVSVSDTGTISVPLSAPVTLRVLNRDFAIQPQSIPENGTWSPTVEDETIAVWVYGTVINYVLGLVDSEANRALIEGLAPGDEIRLAIRDGTTHTFAFNSRRTTPPGERSVFVQNTPGVTVVLIGSAGEERVVVQGRYLVAENNGEEAESTVELGETAQLDGAQVTVTGATYVFDRPEIPPGFAFYMVDYQLQNVSATSLEATVFRLVLVDDLGNQYALNPVASQLGNHPLFTGRLIPGQTLQATAAYQIPAGLNSAILRWLVIRDDTTSQVQVNIPFRGGNEAARLAGVIVQQVDVSLDGTSVLIVGQITNFGDQPLVVQEADVSLSSEGTIHLILSTNPGFPWIVAPGQTNNFSVTFQRPLGSTAVFNVLNQPFQLSGLR